MAMNPTVSHAAKKAAIQIGFQLYTVRGEFSRDVPNTLKSIAQLGYRGVEFWGYGGTPEVYQKFSATDLRKMLDEHGLKCCGMHLELEALEGDNLKRTIDNNQVLDSKYLNVAGAEERMGSEAGIGELAALLNETSAKLKALGMQAGYHAHPFDFEKVNGKFAWQLLFSRTQPQVNMQMDISNCLAGHGDPIAMLKEFPGRAHTIHLREHEEKTFESPFYQEVFHLCETSPATEWYIVEMGGVDGNGYDIPRQALAKLRSLGK